MPTSITSFLFQILSQEGPWQFPRWVTYYRKNHLFFMKSSRIILCFPELFFLLKSHCVVAKLIDRIWQERYTRKRWPRVLWKPRNHGFSWRIQDYMGRKNPRQVFNFTLKLSIVTFAYLNSGFKKFY